MYPMKTINSIDTVSILGVKITNASSEEAIALIEGLVTGDSETTHPIYIVNAHTLNLAAEHSRLSCCPDQRLPRFR